MKKSRFVIPALMAALLGGGMLVATESHARPGHNAEYNDGCGPCTGRTGSGMQLTVEQQKKYDAVVQDFSKRMEPLRDQAFVKRQELNALRNAANPDVKAVRETATELTKIRNQMRDLHTQMTTQLEKETGISFSGRGHRMGRGGMGHGNMGHGNMMMDHGGMNNAGDGPGSI